MAKAQAKVYVNDKVIEKVKHRLEEHGAVDPKRVTVGIHEAEGSKPKLDYNHKETDASLAEVAAAHEFGKGVPERSWLRSWFDRNRPRLMKEAVAAMRAEYKGEHGAIEKQGEMWARELAEWIEYDDAGMDALSPETVKRKQEAGLDKPGTPLFATGELVAAIKSMMTEK